MSIINNMPIQASSAPKCKAVHEALTPTSGTISLTFDTKIIAIFWRAGFNSNPWYYGFGYFINADNQFFDECRDIITTSPPSEQPKSYYKDSSYTSYATKIDDYSVNISIRSVSYGMSLEYTAILESE